MLKSASRPRPFSPSVPSSVLREAQEQDAASVRLALGGAPVLDDADDGAFIRGGRCALRAGKEDASARSVTVLTASKLETFAPASASRPTGASR